MCMYNSFKKTLALTGKEFENLYIVWQSTVSASYIIWDKIKSLCLPRKINQVDVFNQR